MFWFARTHRAFSSVTISDLFTVAPFENGTPWFLAILSDLLLLGRNLIEDNIIIHVKTLFLETEV